MGASNRPPKPDIQKYIKIEGTCGSNDSGTYNNIEFITIATTGNSQDFGDLSETEVYKAGMCSPTRGLFAGGSDPSKSNVNDFVTCL